MVRPGVWLVVAEMRREIAIISTDQATTQPSKQAAGTAAAAAAPSRRPWHVPSEKAPLEQGHT